MRIVGIGAWVIVVGWIGGGCASARAPSPSRPVVTTTRPAVASTRPVGGDDVRFLDIHEHGRRVVFVWECDGSMITYFDTLRVAAYATIDGMKEGQQYNFIRMLNWSSQPMSADWVTMDAAGRARAKDFLDAMTPHNGEALTALVEAFSLKPDVIVLLDNGTLDRDVKHRVVLKAIRLMNADHHTRIHTVALQDDDEAWQEEMRQIAEENGGTYRFLTQDQLFKMVEDGPGGAAAKRPIVIRRREQLEAAVGQRVEVQGKAADLKRGAGVILEDGGPVYVDRRVNERWPAGVDGTLVCVKGVLVKHPGLHDPRVGGIQEDFYGVREAEESGASPALRTRRGGIVVDTRGTFRHNHFAS